MKKVGRNDPCPCGSGKKFKKCCETQSLRGRFKVTPVGKEEGSISPKAAGLTSLFHHRVSPPSKPEFPKETPHSPESDLEAKE